MKGSRWSTGESLTMVSITPARTMSLESFAASVSVSAIGRSLRSLGVIGNRQWAMGTGARPRRPYHDCRLPIADCRLLLRDAQADLLRRGERAGVRAGAHGAAGGDAGGGVRLHLL